MASRTHSIFICYRRDDSGAEALLIHKALCERFGKDHVFIDVINIDFGDRFALKIDERIADCDVLVAVIGPQWATIADAAGEPRIEQPGDYVRHELALALRSGIRVIPVLVGSVAMPGPNALPPDLRDLAGLNATTLTGRRAKEDLDTLVQAVAQESLVQLVARLRRTAAVRRWSLIVVPFAALLMFFGAWVSVFDLLALDTRATSVAMSLGSHFRRAGPSAELALVAITKETEKRYGKPLDRSWRGEHAKLIDALSLAGAEAVVFDLYARERTDNDNAFQQAIADARGRGTSVILGTRGEADASAQFVAAGAQMGLLCAGRQLGYATLVPLAVVGNPQLVSLGLAAASRAAAVVDLDQASRHLLVKTATGVKKVEFSAYEVIRSPQRDCPALREEDGVAELIVEFRPLAALRDPSLRSPYEAIVDRKFSPGRFKGKIVLVGVESDVDKVKVFNGWRSEVRYGFEVHADAINTLLAETAIHPLDAGGQLFLMFCMAGLGAVPRLKPIASRAWSRVYVVAILMGYFALAILVHVQFDVLLNLAYHIGAFLLTYWTSGRIARKLELWDSATHA